MTTAHNPVSSVAEAMSDFAEARTAYSALMTATRPLYIDRDEKRSALHQAIGTFEDAELNYADGQCTKRKVALLWEEVKRIQSVQSQTIIEFQDLIGKKEKTDELKEMRLSILTMADELRRMMKEIDEHMIRMCALAGMSVSAVTHWDFLAALKKIDQKRTECTRRVDFAKAAEAEAERIYDIANAPCKAALKVFLNSQDELRVALIDRSIPFSD